MMTARKAFYHQRRDAGKRGIKFLFTFDQWVHWWETALGEDWLTKRGRGKGKYCMARRGDTGAYEPGNVECILFTQNVTDSATNNTIAFGANAGLAVLNDTAAKDIFTTTETVRAVADRYGIGIGTVIDIRAGRTWCRATAGLTRTSMRGRNQFTL